MKKFHIKHKLRIFLTYFLHFNLPKINFERFLNGLLILFNTFLDS
ncbi:hypothetical protein PTUN_a0938 [Pseudoalteromonas tunicata]|nr:hypothetical protein PTUN_a0938 [Pseudoalteromonas tunicata]